VKAAVFDLEGNNKDPRDVTQVWCCVIKDLSTQEIFKYEQHQMEEALKKLGSYDRLIGHYILFWDFPVLKKIYNWEYSGDPIDTVILSRLAYTDRANPPGYFGNAPHSVEAWSIRLGCEPKINQEDWSAYHPNMLIRCTNDVLITERIYGALSEEMRNL